MSKTIIEDQIERYLRTGEHDPLFMGFPGSDHLDRIRRGHDVLCAALIAEVRSRYQGEFAGVPESLPADISAFARQRIEPMVHGLFRPADRESVATLLANSVQFITPDTVYPSIERENLDSAWLIANLFLRSMGLDSISDHAPPIVGFSVSVTCYVSLEYFRNDAESKFADYVVHEAAHIFHNARRRDADLIDKNENDWLLPIDYSKRETFAYSCEAYSRICELAPSQQVRQTFLEDLKQKPPPIDDQVDANEYFAILTSAVNRRNGWKTILEACSEQTSFPI